VFARARVKQALARVVPERLLRSVYVWIASVLLMVACLAWQPVGGELYAVTGPRAIAHAAVQIAGLVFIARTVARIDALELAGIRTGSFATAGLQTDGPFRVVRHPIYLGWILAAFGAAHMTGDRLTFAAITSLYLVIAVPWEERSLRKSFGDAYARYQREVRWRVLPYVY
jgi:protein-S-isoprenylcysteine O-methyltransferase Ste14